MVFKFQKKKKKRSVMLSITAGSRRFPAVNSQSISVPFGLVNSKKKKEA
jgi:hypothetical protein